MLTNLIKSNRRLMTFSLAGVFAISTLAFGQDPSEDPPPPPQTTQSAPGWHKFSTPPTPAAPPTAPAPQSAPAPVAVPNHITIPAGTFVTVRVDQFLSSDKNKAGDGFSASLARPLVADGLVVARRGETLGGHVVDAKKAGRVKGVSHLQIALNSLTLADGQQVPVETALTSITGTTSNGRDAGAIVTTTAHGRSHWRGGGLGNGRGDWRRSRVGGGNGGSAGDARPSDRHLSGVAIDLPAGQARNVLHRAGAAGLCRCPQPQYSASGYSGASAGSAPARIPGWGLSTAVLLRPYPIYPYYWGPSFGFFYGGGFYGRGFMATASAVKVCPLLTCQRSILRRTAGPPRNGIRPADFFGVDA